MKARVLLTPHDVSDPFVHFLQAHNVNPRLQLRFVAFAMGFPGAMSLLTIFQTFLDGHLKQGFSEEIQAMCVNIINGKGKTKKHIPPFFNRLPMRLFPFMPRLN